MKITSNLNPNLLQAVLLEKRKYSALATLLSKSGPARAVDIWSKLASGEFQEDKESKSGLLDGVDGAVRFLSAHGALDDILEWSHWLLQKAPDQALKIFTAKRDVPLEAKRQPSYPNPIPNLSPNPNPIWRPIVSWSTSRATGRNLTTTNWLISS